MSDERPEGQLFLLGRIDGKLDAILLRQEDHEGRIRTVEKRQWTFAGAVALVSYAISNPSLFISFLPR